MRTVEYNYNVLVGKQSDILALATEFGIDISTLQDRGRRSVTQIGGEWLWMIKLFSPSFHVLVRAWKHDILPMMHWQATQLGMPVGQIRGKDGLPIIENGNIIAGREKALMDWVYLLEPTMPDDLTAAQILAFVKANGTKAKLTGLFRAFETEDL